MFVRVVCRSVLFCRSYHRIGVIGVPFNGGQTKQGVELGPDAIRKSGFIQELIKLDPNLDIKDFGNITYKTTGQICDVKNMKCWLDVSACTQQLSNQVYNVIKENRTCITLGGDHSIALGSVDGHSKTSDLALLWIDAHADINTNKSSDSGNIHGMPLSLLVKELQNEWTTLPMRDWLQPRLSINNLAYIGLRSVDPYEMEVIGKYGVAAYDMKQIRQHGIKNVIEMALKRIDPETKRSLHVSFDIDALDYAEAPSTGTPIPEGLTLKDAIEIMKIVRDTGRLKVLDMVEVNPKIGTLQDVEHTVNAAKEIILTTFIQNR